MKKKLSCNIIIFLLILTSVHPAISRPTNQNWIRINQLGYQPNSIKIAVLASKEKIECNNFAVYTADTDEQVWYSSRVKSTGAYGPFVKTFRLNFSEFIKEGKYYLKTEHVKSMSLS